MCKYTLMAAAVLLAASSAHAQFSIDWFSIDGGGGQMTGETFSLVGTIAQADADRAGGAAFDEQGGFMGGVGAACRADFDQNGLIEPADISLLVNRWFGSLQQGTLEADVDTNEIMEPADVSLFVQIWFTALTSGGC